jgi:ferredoxin
MSSLSLFSIYFFFSDESDYRKARLSSSIVSEILTKEVGNNKMNTWLYLCGPFQYMLMITIVARGMGFVNEQIKKEQFVIEYPSVTKVPPDVTAHTITIIEKRNGVQLPFSCEAGQCGTCSATCVKGKVWMYKNEVLMEDEIGNGRILTCTGYPIDGDIELKIGSVT